MSSESPTPTSTPTRDLTIDAAKGLAITLVVLAHLDRGLIAAGLQRLDGPAGSVDLWLYSFFIPLFVFLSGLFLAGSVAKRGTSSFLRDRVADLMWLYLVWSLINGLMQVIFNRYTNSDQTLGTVLTLWWPLGQMWFLPSLAFATVVVVLLRPWASVTRQWLVLGGLSLIALATWRQFGVWPLAWLQPPLLLFLALGAVVGHRRVAQMLARAKTLALVGVGASALAAAIGLLWLGVAVPTAQVETPDGLLARVGGVLCALLGIVVALTTSAWLARTLPRLASGAAYLGERSLPIYVSHTIFTAGVRGVLSALDVTWIAAYVVLGLMAGLVGPLLIFWAAGRLHMSWLFSFPKRTPQTHQPPTAPS